MNAPSYAKKPRDLTRDELWAEAKATFGQDPKAWAFVCPSCGDVASIAEFIAVGAEPGRTGQECIGRTLGALTGPHPAKGPRTGDAPRGCDWAAYGLFSGPWQVTFPDGKRVPSFALAAIDGVPLTGEQVRS